jgi:hypothetical protein
VTTFKSDNRHLAQITVLHQQTAGDPLVIPARRPRAVPLTAGQHPHVLLAGGHRQCLRRDFRGDDHFDELPVHNRLGGDGVQRPVEGDDAAEGRGRVGLIGAVIGVENGRADRHAAGIGVLDDHAGWRGEALDAFQRGVGVGDVVVGQFLALQLASGGDAGFRRLGST